MFELRREAWGEYELVLSSSIVTDQTSGIKEAAAATSPAPEPAYISLHGSGSKWCRNRTTVS